MMILKMMLKGSKLLFMGYYDCSVVSILCRYFLSFIFEKRYFYKKYHVSIPCSFRI